MRRFNSSPVFAAILLILGLASPAQAALVMYEASLSIQAFGNDTTTGTSYPFSSTVFVGIPFGLTCNPNYGLGTATCGGATPYGQAGSPLSGSGYANMGKAGRLTLPASGLSRVLGKPATSFHYNNPRSVRQPIRCTTLTMTTPGCGVPGGSFSPRTPVSIYDFTYANLKNYSGNFYAGNGPGNASLIFTTGGPAKNAAGKVVVKAGVSRFGGTMRLLGSFHVRSGYFTNNGLSVGDRTWLFQHLGAGGSYTYTGPGTMLINLGLHGTATNIAQHTGAPRTQTTTAKAGPVGWTTGTVSVTATRGPFPTVQQRNGYDNRTVLHTHGTIQLVSPMLTRWRQGVADFETGAIGVLKIQFLPEPSGWLLLAAGVGVLLLLQRASRRG
jgi:hypothetical protein